MEQIDNDNTLHPYGEEQENSIQNTQHFLKWEDKSLANFVCLKCKKTFYNTNALQNHKNTQHDADSSCSEGYNNTSSTRYNDQVFNGLCGFKFIPKMSSEPDQNSVHDGLTTRVFPVDTTYLIVKVERDDQEKSRLDGVKKRTQITAKPPVDLRGPFTCTFPSALHPELQCRQIFFNCCEYSLHYREEHTKRRKSALRCQVCEKRLDIDFFPANTLPAHMHAENRPLYSCRSCSQVFMDGFKYDEHNRIVHAKLKPHQCSTCAKRFTQAGGLQQHMRMHTGIRPFRCTYCPKAFTQKAGLDQHLRTHTKIKPFKCVICSKCFSQSVHLRQHMRTHTNIQPFECNVCGRKFKQSSHLNFHMRSHVGDGTLLMKSYEQAVQQQNQISFLNLSNILPIYDGETVYYAAEMADGSSAHHQQHAYSFQTQ